MLELRPNCEFCDKDLPADATDACICSYECTYCKSCVDNILLNVCPNCGGGFAPRPVRPKTDYREGTSLMYQSVSETRIHSKYTQQEISEFSSAIKVVLPQDR